MNEWEKQPDPIKNDNPPVWELVLADMATAKVQHPMQEKMHKLLIEDMKKRDASGFQKYGVRLQSFNGRNALQDAYEEVLDGIVYTRSAMYEHEKSNLIVTQDSEFFKVGLVQVYIALLDTALKLKFMIVKKKELDGQASTDADNDGSSKELRNNKSNLIIS